jgi:GT2 family glycosyltransferase
VRRSIDIVVVTFNSAEHIGACLRSIAGADIAARLTTVVVDNDSTDRTVEVIRSSHADVRLIANRSNRGFAAACNQGIRAGSGELVLLLNPDAQLLPATLRQLAGYMDRQPRAGIVGPRLVRPDGSLQPDASATGRFPSFRQALFEYTRLGRMWPDSPWNREYFLTGADRLASRPVAMLQGACFLFRRSLLDDVGAFDERFFLYFEETDFCKLAADRNWQAHYVGEAAAIHLGSQSSPARRPSARHFIRSLYAFHHKHYGLREAALLWAILAPYHALRSLRLAALLPFRRHDRQLRADLRTAAERFAAHLTVLGR